MARLSVADLRKRFRREGTLLAPLITGVNPDGTPFTLPIEGNVTANKPQLQTAAEQGKVYFAGSGRITLSVAGNIRATLTNPATATTNIHVVKMAGFTTAITWAKLLLNPTTGLPASAARPVNNNILGQPGDISVLKVDTDATVALGGGTDMGADVGLPNAARWELEFNVPEVLAPGVTLGIAVPFTGSADATMSFFWYRTPA